MANNSRQQYIDQYAEYAMEQMRRYGIPASVTLAQGIIESANGKSTLARTANNHFGVKGEFNGAYVLANDDKPNEKFKKYDNVGQSYEDHSKVLMASRYQNMSGTYLLMITGDGLLALKGRLCHCLQLCLDHRWCYRGQQPPEV